MAKHECTKEPVFTKLFVTLTAVTKDLSYIKKSINGNGTPGLLKKAEEANEFIIKQKQKKESESKVETWSRKKLLFWGGVILVIIELIVRFGFELLKKHFGGG